MKKSLIISFLAVLITAGAFALSQEPQEKKTGTENKENADHRNGAPDMRHKKPIPLPVPPAKAPDTQKKTDSIPEKQK